MTEPGRGLSDEPVCAVLGCGRPWGDHAHDAGRSLSPKRQNKWTENDLSFQATLPCPECGSEMVMGHYYLNPNGGTHQHTRYVCLAWPHPGERCGWEGWSIPGWDAEDRETAPARGTS